MTMKEIKLTSHCTLAHTHNVIDTPAASQSRKGSEGKKIEFKTNQISKKKQKLFTNTSKHRMSMNFLLLL